ncbi:hypothetical protein GTW43_05165 [Streptomyces sp. SID5785]|uniref:hypothetical protein n=1 Tax=Streptomyces sp. SID5785 TaxID=2690309 RepID=UPI0013614E51|nr:hypothetical protein [Streptomyces sp. SID5785]MZD04471.1 hypothetical protein [Streptomyces sp. SID5785]
MVAGLLVGGAVAGLLPATGTGAAFVTLVWAACTLRVLRLDPACPAPGGAPGPGGAGLREPRRPKPVPPSGAIALALPEGPVAGAAGA